MKYELQTPEPTSPPEVTKKPAPRVTLIAGAAIILLACVVVVAKYRPSRSPSAGPVADVPQSPGAKVAPKSGERTARPVISSAKPSAPVVAPSTRPVPNVATRPQRAEPTPYMRGLVSELSRIDLKAGVTPQQAAKWRSDLTNVVQQGAAAVPAIAEFLERNMDLDFSKIPGGKDLGSGSLRLALLDSLNRIGGPEALETMVGTLRTTADPVEIATIARSIEQQSPNQMREALDAAREALAMASKGDLSKVDVSPLFQLMERYGGEEVITDLAKASSQWHYYATMALSDLPEGVGIPALTQLAADPQAAASGSSAVATRLLAQMTFQYPDAQNAILEQARNGQIPDSAWSGIALALGGVKLQYGQDQFSNQNVPPSWTHYVVIGNQNFATVPVLGTFNNDQIQQQISYVDRLLKLETLTPVARQNLTDAKAKLTGGLKP